MPCPRSHITAPLSARPPFPQAHHFIKLLKENLGADYALVKAKDVLEMRLAVFVRNELLGEVDSVESAVGVDLSPHFLAIGKLNAERKELPVSYVHANVDELQMAEAADVVTIAFVFHEMPPEAIANTIRAAYRTLRPGGVFAVLDLDPQKLTKTLTGFRRLACSLARTACSATNVPTLNHSQAHGSGRSRRARRGSPHVASAVVVQVGL